MLYNNHHLSSFGLKGQIDQIKIPVAELFESSYDSKTIEQKGGSVAKGKFHVIL